MITSPTLEEFHLAPDQSMVGPYCLCTGLWMRGCREPLECSICFNYMHGQLMPSLSIILPPSLFFPLVQMLDTLKTAHQATSTSERQDTSKYAIPLVYIATATYPLPPSPLPLPSPPGALLTGRISFLCTVRVARSVSAMNVLCGER